LLTTSSPSQVRAWWRDYFVEADAIVFVVDSSDTERLNEAKEELAGLLAEPSLDDLKGLIVLGNKSDLQASLNTDQLISALALQDAIDEVRLLLRLRPFPPSTLSLTHLMTIGHQQGRPVGVFRCSLVDGTGYLDAFKWLSGRL
jgi:GTPase SAR1 family protein